MGLHLKRQQFQAVQDMLGNKIDGDGSLEVEAIVSKPLSYFQFQRLLQYLDHVSARTVHKQVMDIKCHDVQDVRFSITGRDDITSYCRSKELSFFTAMRKSKNTVQPVNIDQHDIVIRGSKEEKITDVSLLQTLAKSIRVGLKNFRLKQRVSYVPKAYPNFTVDCTAVKMTPQDVQYLHTADISKLPTRYEVEIEYIGEKATPDSAKDASQMFQLIAEVLKVLDDVEYLIPKYQQVAIISDYSSLVFGSQFNYQNILRSNPKKLFAGPQPVSCELKHVVDVSFEPKSLFANYTITHKADGERSLLFVDKTGRVYIINNRMVVKPTKLEVPGFADSLFDAEIIDSKAGKIVMIFDTYFVKKENVASCSLTSQNTDVPAQGTRLSYAFTFANACQGKDSRIIVKVKDFKAPKDKVEFYRQCANLLVNQNSGMLGYKTDGLIFTPLHLPVGCERLGAAPVLSGTWDSVLKWKPPHDNTIDFLVRIKRNAATSGEELVSTPEGLFKSLELYVGQNVQPTSPWGFWSSIQNSMGSRNNNSYIASPFNPKSPFKNAGVCMIPVTQLTDDMKCNNGDLIFDDSIVEMAWIDNKWMPLRVRVDKTELYKLTKSISGTANDMSVAIGVWHTIMYPVLPEYLTGQMEMKLDALPKLEEQYYANNKPREESENFYMNTFHNQWVKKQHLLKSYSSKTSLLDLGCGRGGDIFKWLSAGYKTVVGLDLFDDNISNPHDGAYARLLDIKSNKKNSLYDPRTHKYVFLPFNVAEKINEQSIMAMPNKDNRDIALHLWGIKELKNLPAMSGLFGLATNKFDIVSCQFAVHYFFENDFTLDAFCYNVYKHLKPGGLFLGTCFDGQAIADLLSNVNEGDVVSGKQKNALSWAIVKKYKDYNPYKTGQSISVYVQTINQYITEYLVDYNFLREQLAKYGIRPLTDEECAKNGFKASTGMFSELFNELKEHVQNNMVYNERNRLAACLNMTETEQKFSFLNRWFVFTKDDNDMPVTTVVPPKEVAHKVTQKKDDQDAAPKRTRMRKIVKLT